MDLRGAYVSSAAARLRDHGRMPLVLAGWEDYSVWGWDEQEGTLFAQLWRNTDDSGDPPRHWITPVYGWPETGSPVELAARIAAMTGCALRDALLALAQCAPELAAAELRARATAA
jgi:hypothetical protein